MYMQGWFPLGWTGWISLQSTGLTRVFSNTTVQSIILWCSVLFIVQLSHSYMITGKTIALTIQTFVGQVMSLLFNILCRLLLLLLSRFSRVRLCVTPETAAHQASPSLRFSRQEHGSGLPFPSPMHESEKLKWSSSVMSNSLQPHGLQPTRLFCPWDFPGKSIGVVCHCLLR